MITFRNVSYKIGSGFCLDNLSFALKRKVSVLLGANGAGKTLTLKLMQGVMAPTKGSIEDLSIPNKVMVFQKPLILKQSVRANLMFFLKAAKHSNPSRRISSALKWCGLTHKAEQIATTLSVGQQQLVALARAYALEPKVLLLDEPTSSLDPKSTALLESLIKQLAKQGCKVIMATQSMAQAQRLANEIVLLENGKLITHCDAKEFFKQKPYAFL